MGASGKSLSLSSATDGSREFQRQLLADAEDVLLSLRAAGATDRAIDRIERNVDWLRDWIERAESAGRPPADLRRPGVAMRG